MGGSCCAKWIILAATLMALPIFVLAQVRSSVQSGVESGFKAVSKAVCRVACKADLITAKRSLKKSPASTILTARAGEPS